MSRLLAVAALAVLLTLGPPWRDAAAQSTEEGLVVEGRVVNGTAGGGAVDGLTVVLHRATTEAFDSRDTVTDETGGFRFDGVTYAEDNLYAVAADYKGALYVEAIDLSQGSPGPVSLEIYEAVDDETVIAVTATEMMFSRADADGETLWAWEIVSLDNATDTAYVPGQDPMRLLRFGLPEGARGLYVDTDLLGADVIQVDRGFALTASVPPGKHQVMYAYEFPYSGGSALVSKSLPYGSDALRVLAPPEVATLSSDSLGTPELVDIGEQRYQLLSGSDLPRGSLVPLRLDGLPRASLAGRATAILRRTRLEYAALAGLGLLMASLVLFAVWRRGAASGATASGPPAAAIAGAERARLVREIAALEEGFESGELPERQYRQRREALTARLAAVTGRRPAP